MNMSPVTVDSIVVSLDLTVCGPLALHYKSPLWYWGGRVAVMSSSFPLRRQMSPRSDDAAGRPRYNPNDPPHPPRTQFHAINSPHH